MRRELIRKKWEDEVQEALDKPDGPVHYQDILFDGEKQDYPCSFLSVKKQQQQCYAATNVAHQLYVKKEKKQFLF